MRKLCKNKRGLSTVISTVLMILVVMIGMSILFAFLATYTQNFRSGSGSAVLESITVEDVHFTSGSNVNIAIFNTGKVDFVITSVYINNAASSSSLNLEVKEGAHGELKISSPAGTTFSYGTGYNFKIVTARGTTLEGTYVW